MASLMTPRMDIVETTKIPISGGVTQISQISQIFELVTSAGLVHNAGWQSINNEVDIDDLFHAQ